MIQYENVFPFNLMECFFLYQNVIKLQTIIISKFIVVHDNEIK